MQHNGVDRMAALADEVNLYVKNDATSSEARAAARRKARQLGLSETDADEAVNAAFGGGAIGDADMETWAEARLETVSAADIKPRPVRWVWPERVPSGKLSLLIGDPDVGKTTVAIDLAARLSTGAAWPDGAKGRQGRVLFISAEDDAADTLVPRLCAAGADLDNVEFLQRVMRRISSDEQEAMQPSAFTMEDVEALKVRLRRLGDVGAVVMDPITACLGKVDANDVGQVRGLLWPLIKLAEAQNFALVGIGHLNKAQGTAAIYRALGSIGWVAAARAVYLVVKDQEDDSGARRLFLPVKANLARSHGGLAFTIGEKKVKALSPITAPFVRWQKGEITTTAAQALAEPKPKRETQRGEAMSLLRDMLADGPIAAKDGQEKLQAAGFSTDTIFRARDALGVRSKREHDGYVWSLATSTTKLKLKFKVKGDQAS